MKSIAALALLVVACASVGLLVCGGDVLEVSLFGGLPVGNAVAALAVTSVAGIPMLLSARGTVLRRVAFASFCGALAWLPVSIALAGNTALNFSGWRGSAWLIFSLVIHLVVVCVLLWACVARMLAMVKRSGADSRSTN